MSDVEGLWVWGFLAGKPASLILICLQLVKVADVSICEEDVDLTICALVARLLR